MADEEIQIDSAEIAAPEPETTVVSDSVETSPEGSETLETEEKLFKQADVDRIIAKEKAIERRKWERELAARAAEAQQAPKAVSNEPISADQFETYEDYAQALAERKVAEMIQHREVQKQRSELDSVYADREEEARTKYDDFEQVAYNPNLPITQAMAETIKASEVGPDLAYWLGSNPKEADRISRLSPLLQAREIGKIEVKLSTEPPAKKTTSAPDPIVPVTARKSSSPSYDTTDPRSIKTMSDSEWIEAERQRQIKKAQSQYR